MAIQARENTRTRYIFLWPSPQGNGADSVAPCWMPVLYAAGRAIDNTGLQSAYSHPVQVPEKSVVMLHLKMSSAKFQPPCSRIDAGKRLSTFWKLQFIVRSFFIYISLFGHGSNLQQWHSENFPSQQADPRKKDKPLILRDARLSGHCVFSVITPRGASKGCWRERQMQDVSSKSSFA